MTTPDEPLPAELRGAPPDGEDRLPPEAAGVAAAHEERATPPRDGGTGDVPYEALAAAETAADRAHLLPAEMRVEPTVEPEVEVAEGVQLPPEAGVIPVTHHEDPQDPQG
jgi:hypothetical protein